MTTVWVSREAKSTIKWTDRVGRIVYPVAFLLIAYRFVVSLAAEVYQMFRGDSVAIEQ